MSPPSDLPLSSPTPFVSHNPTDSAAGPSQTNQGPRAQPRQAVAAPHAVHMRGGEQPLLSETPTVANTPAVVSDRQPQFFELSPVSVATEYGQFAASPVPNLLQVTHAPTGGASSSTGVPKAGAAVSRLETATSVPKAGSDGRHAPIGGDAVPTQDLQRVLPLEERATCMHSGVADVKQNSGPTPDSVTSVGMPHPQIRFLQIWSNVAGWVQR